MEIAVMADKGGVGKTLLSAHLAARLAQVAPPVSLVDLDARQASSRWLSRAGEAVAVYTLQDMPDDVPGTRLWDTPAHPSTQLRHDLASQCDATLIVVTDDLDAQLAAVDVWREIAGVSPVTRVVINDVYPSSSPAVLREELRDLGLDVLDSYVRRYACYTHAKADGRLVCDYPYSRADEAWSDIKAVCEEVLSCVKAV